MKPDIERAVRKALAANTLVPMDQSDRDILMMVAKHFDPDSPDEPIEGLLRQAVMEKLTALSQRPGVAAVLVQLPEAKDGP